MIDAFCRRAVEILWPQTDDVCVSILSDLISTASSVFQASSRFPQALLDSATLLSMEAKLSQAEI